MSKINKYSLILQSIKNLNMKKYFLLLCLTTLGLFNQSLFSQTSSVNIDTLKSRIENTPYIFKGEIIDIQYYLGDENGNKLEGTYYLPNGKLGILYSSAKVQICQILKGEDKLKPGTIEIITSSPNLVQPYLYPTEKGDTLIGRLKGNFCTGCENPIFLDNKFSAIFFCQDALYKGKSKFQFENENGVYFSSLLFTRINTNWIGYNLSPEEYNDYYKKEISNNNSSKENISYSGLNGTIFYSPAQLYDYYKQFDGININAFDHCKKTYFLPENKDSIDQIKIQNQIRYEQNLKNYNKNMEQMIKLHNIDTTKTFEEQKKSKLRNQIQKKSKNEKGSNLSLEIVNSILTGTSLNDAYMEFDIKASSNLPVYLSSCLIRISYNTAAFGSNLAANNNVTITRGSAFDNSTYTNPDNDKIDITSSVIAIPFNEDVTQTNYNRTSLNSFPEVLMHVKMKIKNNGCNENANIEFADITLTPMFSYFTVTSNAGITDGVSFDNTTYSSGVFDKTCVPIISNFTNNVPAGNGSTITITGKYFGASKGVGTVIFKNADKGNTYPVLLGSTTNELIGIDNYDTISWSDNEIVLKMPSTLEHSTLDATNPVPGSGLFKVKNFTTSEAETTSPIVIPFAVYQYLDYYPTYRKVSASLSGQDNNGYTVHLSPDITTAFPNAKVVIKKAMKDWNCVSGINWQIGNDTIMNTERDGLCVINIGSFSALQRTYREFGVCPSATGNTYYLKSFDIEIKNPFTNPLYSWQVDTIGDLGPNKFDFYHAMTHELGHAHLLEHANDTLGDIMFYAAWNGPYPFSQRKTVALSSGASLGAQYVTDNLTSSLTCTGAHLIVEPTNCTGFIGVKENVNNQFDIIVYPNPSNVNQNITISLKLEKESLVYFSLFDYTGRLIKNTEPVAMKETDYSFSMEGVNQGLYLLQIIVGTKKQSVKIIKQ